MTLREVYEATTRAEIAAQPVQPKSRTSPWLTAPPDALSGLRKVIGQSDYTAYAGACTWLNAVYWIRVIETLPSGELLIENLHDVGKIKVDHVQTVIEPDLVYPLLRGRDVHRWRAEPSAHIILANRTDKLAGIPESQMKLEWPKTYAYLKRFEGDRNRPTRGTLRGRSGYRQYFKPSDPFYSMYNVGPYTMAEWKVVWPWISTGIKPALVNSDDEKSCMPEHNTSFCGFTQEEEAHFFCGLFGSRIIDLSLRSMYSGGGGGIASPSALGSVAIPQYNKRDYVHIQLAELSHQCHEAAAESNERRIAELEAEIDELAARIWGITGTELAAIQTALANR